MNRAHRNAPANTVVRALRRTLTWGRTRGATKPGGLRQADVERNDATVAACALLLEIAHADATCTEDARRHVVSTVRGQFGVDAAGANALLARAEAARAGVEGLWQLTKPITELYSAAQKRVLAEIMHALVGRDGEVSRREAYLLGMIGSLLRLEPSWAL